MGWFSKKEAPPKVPSEMSPIESVTYLCTAIQISDGQIDNEEKNIWLELVTELFPEFSEIYPVRKNLSGPQPGQYGSIRANTNNETGS